MSKSRKPRRPRGKVAQPSYMGKLELRSRLAILGLESPSIAARFLRIHPRTVYRLLKGETPVDASTAMLLHILVKYQIPASKAFSHLEG